ncbi:hypothetical protein GCM10009069_08600 [Algimonas arctica]|uniref:Gcp-like domain-containing protein n=1 Tax=Algimonas arctica TaxID=1479486 RepID=A0A8J3CN96_9PROT|nr:tRNA (adenosine(37)-N6)-threonylcarbamoyltransferase complex dimerization subunit type 1 TsaB [Algimonas arctica]GHA87929.1 hypothetical protein GCM10009069_08600 [Algimonas arctica]
MVVLGLDTTGADCSACVVRDETVLAYLSEPIGRGHAERLAPMVVEVLREAGVTPEDIDRIAVCTGPGSFTGLRVALSFAKGFALPRRTPVVGIDALAATYLSSDLSPAHAMVWTDVKRGQIMFGTYSGAGPLIKGEPKTGTREDMRKDAEPYQFDVLEALSVDVRVIAKAVATMPADHLTSYPANPLYARAPDAKLPGGITPPAQPA